MASNFNTNNLVGTHIYPVADLGLVFQYGNNEEDTATAIVMPYPGTVVVLSKLVSGAATIAVDVAATEATLDYGSPTASLSASGTGRQWVAVDTDMDYVAGTSTLFVGIKVTAGASGVQIGELAVLMLYELDDTEDFYSIRMNGATAIAAVDGVHDGKGLIDFDIA